MNDPDRAAQNEPGPAPSRAVDGETHEVDNQAPPLQDYDAFSGDAALGTAMRVFGADWAQDHLAATGRLVGGAALQEKARQANRYPPELRTHDRFGHRIDMVEYHPAYHALMASILGSGTHSFAWTHRRPGGQVARAALSYLWSQGENGVCCPIAMTFASIAALRHDPAILAAWEPRITSTAYDPRPLPAARKAGITVAMAMTEKQGGSDLRATATTAEPEGPARGPGEAYRLTGHKWFFSAPMSDLVLTLAQARNGLSCFVAPGYLPDGTRNRLRLMQLKEKCGNRSNASSAVEFDGLHAVMLGEEGRGLRTILEMAHLTRLECAISSAALMRQALSQAIHHAQGRRAFQRRLLDLPAMTQVLADLAVECEAAMWLAMRMAAALDRAETDRSEALLSRIGTPVAKFWACKRAPAVVAEALECHGGNGFVADHPLERLYREAPLNGIWEGSGNVVALDVLRAVHKEPASVDAVLAEVSLARGLDPRLDAAADRLADMARRPTLAETGARRLVEAMALALQGSLLLRHAPAVVAEAFCATRLGPGRGSSFGAGPEIGEARAISERAAVA